MTIRGIEITNRLPVHQIILRHTIINYRNCLNLYAFAIHVVTAQQFLALKYLERRIVTTVTNLGNTRVYSSLRNPVVRFSRRVRAYGRIFPPIIPATTSSAASGANNTGPRWDSSTMGAFSRQPAYPASLWLLSSASHGLAGPAAVSVNLRIAA